ncbi:fimbrillin family protein [Bacteroides gallinaceum]|uniref:fimbrillin family protein n=1 Tax=Bacteroides gallinaceum TaxID=1462571 RepID=UPI0025AAB600|nr:fimbrillin family protein [Bacteroides gallinaceum]MDN0067045.1 fimbrillin family protein [Bacteroides gallinaceum]
MIHLSVKKRYALIAALSMLIATSCTNDNEPEAARGIAFQSNVQTRAVKENFTSGDAFTVWGGYDGDATNVFNGETVTFDGANWSYTGTRYWVSGKMYNFYAVYPTEYGTCSTDGTIIVSDFDTSDNTDLMTAEALGMNGSNPQTVPFTFRHELARVSVVVQNESGIAGNATQVSFSDISTTGTLTRSSSTNASWNNTSSTLISRSDIPISASGETILLEDLLLIPQTLSGKTLSVIIDRSGTTLAGNLNLSGLWEAGHTYRYVITVQADAITFSNFTADEWGETHTGGDINIGGSTN